MQQQLRHTRGAPDGPIAWPDAVARRAAQSIAFEEGQRDKFWGNGGEMQDKCWTWKTFTLPDVEENS